MRILFIGDSITDAGRDKRNYFNLGRGYANAAAENLKAAYPEKTLEFINLGINGNRTSELFDRLYPDCIFLKPDVVSVMIGINDVWHRHGNNVMTTDAQIKLNYRCILEAIKRDTTAKIVMMAPFMLDVDDKEEVREDLNRILPAIYELAEEFADVFLPLDQIFGEALKTQPEPHYYSRDGVHLNPNGAAFVGKLWTDAVKEIL